MILSKRLAQLILLFTLLGCRSTGDIEKIYSEIPPTWFESRYDWARMSRDGNWALYGGFNQIKLINLETGDDHSERLTRDLVEVNMAFFDANNDIVFRGRRGDETGWFIEDEAGLRHLSLPTDIFITWSPDGSQVAYFTAYYGTDFHAGSIDDATPNQFDGHISGIAWHPDGKSIFILMSDENGHSTLASFTPETRETEVLLQDLDADPVWSPIAISPDGQHVFISLASDTTPVAENRHIPHMDRDLNIYDIDLVDGSMKIIVDLPGDDIAPQYSNGHIYWTRNDQEISIVTLPITGGDINTVFEGGIQPTWHPTGKQIGFTDGDWRLADYVLNLDGAVIDVDAEGRPVSSAKPIVTGYHEDFSPVWSPDGKWIAYHSHRSNTPVSLYEGEGSTDDVYLKSALDTSAKEIRITNFGWEVHTPDWASDGKRLLLTSWERAEGRPNKLWLANINDETGEPLRIEEIPLPDSLGRLVAPAVWSPLSDEIAVATSYGSGHRAIWIVKPDGTPVEKLVDFDMHTYGGLDWTPDGKSIIFSSLVNGTMQLHSISREGGLPRQLTHDDAHLFQHSISPDGRLIAATRQRLVKEILRLKYP